LNNVQNINAEGGDLTIKSITEEGETVGGNIFADGNVTASKFIGDIQSTNG